VIIVKRILPFLVCSLFVTLPACKQQTSAAKEKEQEKETKAAAEVEVKPVEAPAGTTWGKPGVLYPVLKGGKYGFIDNTGKMVIEPAYYSASRFSEDLAMVVVEKTKNKFLVGYIDKSGKMVIEPQFEGGGLFYEGLAMIKKNKKAGVINTKGEIVIEAKFERISRFHDGLAAAVVTRDSRNGTPVSDGGYIDRKGTFVIHPQFDPNLTAFTEGVAGVRRVGQLWSFMDRSEKTVIPPKFFMVGQMSGGMAAFLDGASKWGYMDRSGQVVIPAKFSRAGLFGDGLAAVLPEQGKKWGFIDTKGNMVIKPQFDGTDVFKDGVAMVELNGQIGYIDAKGQYVWPLTK
jgi:hypothetical protein